MIASVVIPVYNGSDTLNACLQSLAHQSMKRDDFEIIVVDDGSRDESAAIARRSGASVITQHNAGAPAARNAGVRAARGDWIAFTDSKVFRRRSVQRVSSRIARYHVVSGWLVDQSATALLTTQCQRESNLSAVSVTRSEKTERRVF